MKRWGKCTGTSDNGRSNSQTDYYHDNCRDEAKAESLCQPVTDCRDVSGHVSPLLIIVVAALSVSLPLAAAILPEDRTDAFYHRYDGGGVTVDGPALMARKQVGQNVSVLAEVYEDSVTSASIDVVTTASPYTDKRDEKRLGLDYLHGNTTMNLTFINSVESDYAADTYHFSVSHDMFGDLTTVTLGYGVGHDDVGQNIGGTRHDKGKTDHHKYSLGVSQILTKNLVVSSTLELDADEGFLNNPYREVLVLKRDLSGAVIPGDSGFLQLERYPGTRTSNALGVVAKYYLPYRAALSLGYRTYSDTWDVQASMYEIGYTQPLKNHWTFDFSFRTYNQTQASFYADYFYASEMPYYHARFKDLSTYGDNTVGIGLKYEFGRQGFWIFDKGSVSLNYSHIQFDFLNFTDQRPDPVTNALPLANGKPYSFSADVFRFFVSVWY